MALTFQKSVFPHSVTIEAYTGNSAIGPLYAAAVTVRCLIEEKRRFVRNREGNQVQSPITLYCAPGTSCPQESKVTVNGKVCTAIMTTTYDGGSLPLPGCVVVHLT